MAHGLHPCIGQNKSQRLSERPPTLCMVMHAVFSILVIIAGAAAFPSVALVACFTGGVEQTARRDWFALGPGPRTLTTNRGPRLADRDA